MRRPLIAALALALAAALGTGCDADCKAVCKKLIKECEYGDPGYGIDQCEGECQARLDDLENEPDAEAAQESFQEQMNCIRDAECAALTDPADPAYPACYDPDTSVF